MQEQSASVQDFQKSLATFSPQLDSLAATATQCDLTNKQQEQSATSKQTEATTQYNKLKVLAEERQSMLSGYLPDIQRYESSRVAWESLLCGWEETESGLPSPGATPESVQAQIEEIKVCSAPVPSYPSFSEHEHTYIFIIWEWIQACMHIS